MSCYQPDLLWPLGITLQSASLPPWCSSSGGVTGGFPWVPTITLHYTVFICLVRLLSLEWKHHKRQGPESVRCCVLGAQTAPLIRSYSKWWIGTVERWELLSFRSVWSCEKMHVLSAFTQSCLSCWGQAKGCLFPKDNRDPGFLWSFKKGLI